MNKRKIKFIINPVSGVGKQKKIAGLIKKTIDQDIIEYSIAYTRAARHAIELSKQAALENFDVVVAVGGDGSVNEVGAGLIGSNTAMGIIPTGSGNGLARHVGIPTNIKKALHVLNTGKAIAIDTISVNQNQYLGIGGVGFDAHVAHEFANYGKRGFSSYLKIICREFSKYQSKSYNLVIDGQTYNKEAFLITVANASQFGNNAVIAPEADIQDGLMDVCILKKAPYLSVLRLVIQLFNKTVNRSVFMEIIRCKSITIQNNVGGILHLDGEPKIFEEELTFQINPLSLKIWVP